MYVWGYAWQQKRNEAQRINCTHYLGIDRQRTTESAIHAQSLPQESVPMASESRFLNELFPLFYLSIMHRVLINANSAHVLMMYHCALGILKFSGALLILPTLYSAFQHKAS